MDQHGSWSPAITLVSRQQDKGRDKRAEGFGQVSVKESLQTLLWALLLSSHWLECSCGATTSCKGGWEM